MRKIIFLDIDGTLVSFDGVLSEKTKEALGRAKEAGHILMLCTGRTRCQVKEELLEDGFFDGMVTASGAYMEYKKQGIYRKTMEPELLLRLVKDLRQAQIPLTMMEKGGLYTWAGDLEATKVAINKQMPGMGDKIDEMMGGVAILGEEEALPVIEKITYEGSPCSFKEVKELIGPSFDLVPSSFHQEAARGGEITIAGVTKASGMEVMLRHLGMDRRNTIAFGDSYNDLEMLGFAAIGVAMGNAPEEVKQAADMVTDAVDEDGLYNGFLELGLI